MADINDKCKLVYEILIQASNRSDSDELATKSSEMANEIRQYAEAGEPPEQLAKTVQEIYHNYYSD